MDKTTKITVMEASYKAASDALRDASRVALEAGIAAAEGNIDLARGIALEAEQAMAEAVNLMQVATTVAMMDRSR